MYARVEDKAPPHPPCFDSQANWIEYIAWAMLADDGEVRGLRRVRVSGGTPHEFNEQFNFCADCIAGYRQKMQQEGRCKPTWLIAEKVTG